MFVLRSYSGKRMVFSEITILILFLVFGMVFEFRETGTIFYSESSQSKSWDHLKVSVFVCMPILMWQLCKDEEVRTASVRSPWTGT